VRPDAQLPAIFTNGNCCLLDAFALRETTTPQRVIRNYSGFETRLSPMKQRALRLQLDGATYAFVEARGHVVYLPSDAHELADPPPRMVSVQMAGHLPTRSDLPPRITLPPTQLEPIDPHRMVAVHIVKTATTMTLLLIDESRGPSNDKPIAIIGDALHWNLAGIDVQFQSLGGA
jgi:hypothetical protein